MATQVRALVSKQPITIQPSTPIVEAASKMRSSDVGALIVEENGKPVWIVTDRDIAVRAVAEGLDASTPVSRIASRELTTISPDDDLERAIELMRAKALRRLVVSEGDRTLGVLSLGDLALEKDAPSVLGQISAARGNA